MTSANNKFFQSFLYVLCIALVPSTMYDMSYAFTKIVSGGAEGLYIVIFVVMAMLQVCLIVLMVYAVRNRAQKVATYLGRYLFFAPICAAAFFIVTDGVNVGNLLVYFLPMFHRISSDIYEVIFGTTIVLYLDRFVNFGLILLYGMSFMWAAKIYISELKD